MRRDNLPTEAEQEKIELEARLAVDRAFARADKVIRDFRYRLFEAFTRRDLGYETFDRIFY